MLSRNQPVSCLVTWVQHHPWPCFFSLLLLFRVWLAATLPLTGDEAYFVLWGRFPDWGYYDHPPMVGWWLSALLPFGDSPLWLRLPSVFLPFVLAFAMLKLLDKAAPEQLRIAACLLVLAPPNVWNVLITTDTPLMAFGVLSALFFIRAFLSGRWWDYTLCGLLFAGAVLSKYFIALLGLAFAVATLLAPSRRRFLGLFWIAALMLPALALMVWWNAENCWPNVLFNLVKRNAGAGLGWQHLLTYGLMLVYVLGFWPVLALRDTQHWKPWRMDETGRLFWALAWVPLFLFGALSLFKQIGLHWLLTFIPLVLIAFARGLSPEAAQACRRKLGLLAGIHVLIFVGFLAWPLSAWQNRDFYPGMVLTFETPKVWDSLAAGDQSPEGNVGEARHWMAEGYTDAALLSYARLRAQGRSAPVVGVFGTGSHYARQDDRLTDFRELSGRNLGIFLKSQPRLEEYAPYFEKVSLTHLEVLGATFFIVQGDGFRYPAYRDTVLRAVQNRFYQFPAWLKDCGCFFQPRYFPLEGA